MNDQTEPEPRTNGVDGQIVFIPDLKVTSGGRVTIPDDQREMYDISEGDVLDCMFVTDDGTDIEAPGRKVREEWRVTIPARQRERYGIEDGDYIDLSFIHEE